MAQPNWQQMEHALRTLGVFDRFRAMNLATTSFDQLNANFVAFREHVKKQYLEKAKVLHPDKKEGDQERMKELNAAFDLFKHLRLQKRSEQRSIVVTFQTSFYGSATTTTDFTHSTIYPGTTGF